MDNMRNQVAGEGSFYGSITTMEDLEANLVENCVPVEFMEMDISDYARFLDIRRAMMARYIREYYRRLN